MEEHEIVRSMIKSENEMVNNLLTWRTTLKGLLFRKRLVNLYVA